MHVLFDYLNANIDVSSRMLLTDLLSVADVVENREALFDGERFKAAEARAVLHTAVRHLNGDPVFGGGILCGGQTANTFFTS